MTLTLKKRLKNAGILTAVFIVAVIIFSYVTNKGNDNMTADMGAATFPQISFSYGEYKINTLTGYAKRMDISSMHNTITPVANQILDVNVEAYGNKFTGASYKVYTMDGASQLEHKKIKKVSTPVVTNLWKERDMEGMRKISRDASLMNLIAGCFLFVVIWVNLDNIFSLMPESYAGGRYVFLFLGLGWVVNMYVGLNRDRKSVV